MRYVSPGECPDLNFCFVTLLVLRIKTSLELLWTEFHFLAHSGSFPGLFPYKSEGGGGKDKENNVFVSLAGKKLERRCNSCDFPKPVGGKAITSRPFRIFSQKEGIDGGLEPIQAD